MIIIIDGYNVLKQYTPGADVSHSARTRFIAHCAQYARRKNHTLIVVFDGGPHQWMFKEVINGVTVVYSGQQKTADDVIKGYIEQYHSHDALLVSSDRELNVCAQAHGVTSINSRDFYQLMREDVNTVQQSKKTGNDVIIKLADATLPEVDELMRSLVGNVPIKKEDFGGSQTSKSASKKMSKEERMLLKKLKKL
jgi:predicted RNA-binding protein with PIN domain